MGLGLDLGFGIWDLGFLTFSPSDPAFCAVKYEEIPNREVGLLSNLYSVQTSPYSVGRQTQHKGTASTALYAGTRYLTISSTSRRPHLVTCLVSVSISYLSSAFISPNAEVLLPKPPVHAMYETNSVLAAGSWLLAVPRQVGCRVGRRDDCA